MAGATTDKVIPALAINSIVSTTSGNNVWPIGTSKQIVSLIAGDGRQKAEADDPILIASQLSVSQCSSIARIIYQRASVTRGTPYKKPIAKERKLSLGTEEA
jgi:hypothetical protein